MKTCLEKRQLFIQKIKPKFLQKRSAELMISRSNKLAWDELNSLVNRELILLFNNLTEEEREQYLINKEALKIDETAKVTSVFNKDEHERIIKEYFAGVEQKVVDAITLRRKQLLSKATKSERCLKRLLDTAKYKVILRFPVLIGNKQYYPNLFFPDLNVAINILKPCGKKEYEESYLERKNQMVAHGIKVIEITKKTLKRSDCHKHIIDMLNKR